MSGHKKNSKYFDLPCVYMSTYVVTTKVVTTNSNQLLKFWSDASQDRRCSPLQVARLPTHGRDKNIRHISALFGFLIRSPCIINSVWWIFRVQFCSSFTWMRRLLSSGTSRPRWNGSLRLAIVMQPLTISFYLLNGQIINARCLVSRAETCKSALRNQSKQTGLMPEKALCLWHFLHKNRRFIVDFMKSWVLNTNIVFSIFEK